MESWVQFLFFSTESKESNFHRKNLRSDIINRPCKITNGEADAIRQHLQERHRLIFDFGIESGLRISDILRLKWNQFGQKMKVYESKTKKYKPVELTDRLFSRINQFRGLRQGYVFNSPRSANKPLHRSTYHLHLKKAFKSTGVNLSAHSTRKLYAMNIYEQSGDVFAVQAALNHKYIQTTFAYLDIDLNALLKSQTKGEP